MSSSLGGVVGIPHPTLYLFLLITMTFSRGLFIFLLVHFTKPLLTPLLFIHSLESEEDAHLKSEEDAHH